MKINDRTSRGTWIHILLVGVLLILCIGSFHIFTVENRQRILAQNQEYIADVTLQTTDRLEEILEIRQKNVEVLAITVEQSLTRPEVGQALLARLQETSSFDYVEFIDKEGWNHNAEGVQSDSRDRENYLRGIKGESGTSVIFNSRITHETLVDFYTPINFNGEIIGVLNGMYREANLREAISTELFGTQAKTYLCMKDGTVITSNGDDAVPGNILLDLKKKDFVRAEVLSEIEAAFSAHASYNYTYTGPYGIGNACLIPIADSDWMLLQAFPATVSASMEERANSAGVRLEGELLGLFTLYLIYVLCRAVSQRKRLVSEKERLHWIVEGLVPLFARLLIIDYRKNTYEYVENTQPDIPSKGSLKDLMDFMLPRYRQEDGVSIPPLTQDAAKEQMALDNKAYLQYEYRVLWGEEERWENTSVLSLEEEGGVPVTVLFAVQDVTALKQQEQKIRETLEGAFNAAEEANHAKSDFLARMSHDMRTPMNAVMGMTSIAMMHLDDTARIRDCLNKINASSQHLLSLINEVLDMSKIESGSIDLTEEPFLLFEVVEQVLSIVRPQAAAKKQDFSIDCGELAHEAVYGDPARLRQILLNVLDNAVKYTPVEGTVSFQIREIPSQGAESVRFRFTVQDTGIGMEESFIPQVFEPFTRSETSQLRHTEGTGLGMPIARTLARIMDGDIHVESEVDKGSTFIIELALKAQENQPASSTAVGSVSGEADLPGEQEIREYPNVRLLLAEDNELNAEIAIELLSMAGIETELAHDGGEAVEMMAKSPLHYYDLIFMDIQMPVKNGFEATREIRALPREDAATIPIVAMSANAFTEDVKKSLDAGMNDHVAKPADLGKFLGALDKWLPEEKRSPDSSQG